MKTTKISILLSAGFLINSAFAAAPEVPQGTLKISGDTKYGSTPTLSWTLNKPQVASNVLEFINPIDKATSTLIIKQKSLLKITVIGTQSYDHDAHRRVSIIRNRNGSTTSHPFFEGSSDNFNGISNTYWAVQPADELKWKSSKLYFEGEDIHWGNWRDYYDYYLPNGIGKNRVKKNYVRNNSFTIDVEPGDKIDFLSQFWSDYYRHCHSAFAAYDYHDYGYGNDPGQKNMISLFDGDVIPTNPPGAVGQISSGDLLKPYASDTGSHIKLAPNQMINLVDNNPKYEYKGRGRNRKIKVSSGYDINDFIFMVEVGNSHTFTNNDSYRYFLVKYDRKEPAPQYDDQGNIIERLDENGHPIIFPGDDKFNFEAFQGTIGLSGTYDEIHEIGENETSYQFTTPNGRYGSEYKLIYVRVTSSGGPDEEDTDNDEEQTIASLFHHSDLASYFFEISDLTDQYKAQKRMMGDSSNTSLSIGNEENGEITFTPVKKHTYKTMQVISNLSPPPSPDATEEELKDTPKGSYSVSFEHKKFTFSKGCRSPEEGFLEASEATFVKTGENPTKELTKNGTFVKNNLEQLIATTSGNTTDKNGEEQFNAYSYLATWGLGADNTPYIIGYQKILIDNQNIKVWAAPTAKVTVIDPAVNNTYRKLPKFNYAITNIYPGAQIKAISRPKSGTPSKGILIGSKYLNGNNLPKLTFEQKYLSPITDASLLNSVEDGTMVTEIVHMVDYDDDGDYDDIRVLDSFEWTLKRDIIIKGGVNTN